ncbi:hypothetical protein [Metamycoplasma hominis]|nr:hypothetical protein [Metamycoplasma hominis]
MQVKNAKKFALATIILYFICVVLLIPMIILNLMQDTIKENLSLFSAIALLSFALEYLGAAITFITFYIITIVNGFYYKETLGSILMCVGIIVPIVGIIGTFFVYFNLKKIPVVKLTTPIVKPTVDTPNPSWNVSDNNEDEDIEEDE